MKQETAEYQLFDDPESQIRFLEVALGDQEWRARIHLPDFLDEKAKTAAHIRKELQHRGYHVRTQKDADGHWVLSVHHAGRTPNIAGLFRDYGLATGTAHIISHPLGSMKGLLQGTHDAARAAAHYARDPARANGLIFISAEAFLLAAAGGNPHGKWYNTKNLLQGIAATCFLSQSASYAFWAKKGDDRIASDFQKQLNLTNGHDFDHLQDAKKLTDRPTRHALHSVRRTLEDHPIQTGAIMNNAGMLAYMAHAVLERRHRMDILKTDPTNARALRYINKGFPFEIFGIGLSLAGWSSLLLKPKIYEEKSSDPLMHAYQSYRENPQYLTAITSIISSSSRLKGALDKPNFRQAIGEGLYIPGDILLFFVKNHDYGASRHGDYDGLIEKISGIINAMPAAISPQQQEALYTNTASYLAKQHAALAEDGKQLSPEEIKAEEATLRAGLAQQSSDRLNERFNQLIEHAHQLIHQFPKSQQPHIAQTLAEALPTLAGVVTTPDELASLLQDGIHKHANEAYDTPDMQTLAPVIGELVFSIPNEHAGDNAMILYRALAPVMRHHGQEDSQTLHTAMSEQAERAIAAPGVAASWQARAEQHPAATLTR